MLFHFQLILGSSTQSLLKAQSILWGHAHHDRSSATEITRRVYSREEGTGSSARGGGAQGKNFSSGALGGPVLQPSPSLPGHQLPGPTGRSTGLAGHAKSKDSCAHSLAPNGSLQEKGTGLSSNSFCFPLPVARRRAPGCHVTGMQHCRHGDVGTWHQGPSFC